MRQQQQQLYNQKEYVPKWERIFYMAYFIDLRLNGDDDGNNNNADDDDENEREKEQKQMWNLYGISL